MIVNKTSQSPPPRFYVAPGKYLLPADDPEAARLKNQNDVLRRLFDNKSVLDLPGEWTDKCDLVHQHLLLAALKYDEWAVAVKEIFRVTKPGGFAELCKCNPLKTSCGPRSEKYLGGYRQLTKHYNIDFEIAQRMPDLLLEAGFVNIHAEVKIVKFGPAGGEDGRSIGLNLAGVARGLGGPLAMAACLGVVNSQSEWEAFIDDVEKE